MSDIRRTLERARLSLDMHEIFILLGTALTQLSALERDREAMEKLRNASEYWSLGRRPDGIRFHANPKQSGMRVGTGLYRCEMDPADAILGTQEARDGDD